MEHKQTEEQKKHTRYLEQFEGFTSGESETHLLIDQQGRPVVDDSGKGVRVALSWECDEYYDSGEYQYIARAADVNNDIYVNRKLGMILGNGDDFPEGGSFAIGDYDFEWEQPTGYRAYDFEYRRSVYRGRDSLGYLLPYTREICVGENREDDYGDRVCTITPLSASKQDQVDDDLQEIGIVTDAPISFVAEHAEQIAEQIEAVLQAYESTHIEQQKIYATDLPRSGRNECEYFVSESSKCDYDVNERAKYLQQDYERAEQINSGPDRSCVLQNFPV
jgi:hypothetical protein